MEVDFSGGDHLVIEICRNELVQKRTLNIRYNMQKLVRVCKKETSPEQKSGDCAVMNLTAAYKGERSIQQDNCERKQLGLSQHSLCGPVGPQNMTKMQDIIIHTSAMQDCLDMVCGGLLA